MHARHILKEERLGDCSPIGVSLEEQRVEVRQEAVADEENAPRGGNGGIAEDRWILVLLGGEGEGLRGEGGKGVGGIDGRK